MMHLRRMGLLLPVGVPWVNWPRTPIRLIQIWPIVLIASPCWAGPRTLRWWPRLMVRDMPMAERRAFSSWKTGAQVSMLVAVGVGSAQ